MGVNATMGNNLELGNDCLIGSFVHITRNIPSGSLLKGTPNKADEVSTWERFKLDKI